VVKINRELCIGCGACQSICPEVFEIDDEAKAIILTKKNSLCIKEAIDSCPAEAISE